MSRDIASDANEIVASCRGEGKFMSIGLLTQKFASCLVNTKLDSTYGSSMVVACRTENNSLILRDTLDLVSPFASDFDRRLACLCAGA